MKPSPVQLVQLMFDKVSIELDPRHAPQEPYGFNTGFSFDGVLLKTQVWLAEREQAASEERVFEVLLALSVENKKQKDKKAQRFSPYLLDFKARAVVRLPGSASKLAPPEDLVVVNGAALLWGAMREQIASMTARMPAGQIILPTVHFQDLRSDVREAARDLSQSKAAEPAAGRQELPMAGESKL